MKKLTPLFAAACLFGGLPQLRAETSDAAARQQQQSARRLMTDLTAAINARQPLFRIPAGTYRFDDHFQLDHVRDIVIDGQGSTFIFKLGKSQIKLRSCRNVTLKNLDLDLDYPPIIQGTIAAVDPTAQTIDFKVDPGYFTAHPFDPKRRLRCMLIDAAGQRELPVPDATTPPPVRLPSGLLRINPSRVFSHGPGLFAPGDRVVLSLHCGGGGISLKNSSAVTLENIVIYASGGFAIHESGISEGGNTYRRCKLIPRPGSGRLAAGAADAFHSMHQKKGPHLIECELSHAFDDLINIHGFLNLIIEKRAPDQLVIASPFEQDFGVGDTLHFYRSPDAVPAGKAKIVQCVRLPELTAAEVEKKVSDYYARVSRSRPIVRTFPSSQPCLVTLDRPLDLRQFDLACSDGNAGRGAIIEKCRLHDGHIRGILLKSPDAVVRNCEIRRIASSGIILKPEQYWLEGPFPDNIKITDNLIADCGGSSINAAAIEIRSEFGTLREKLTNACNIRQIEIARNRIDRAAGIAIKIANADDVLIRDNIIVDPLSRRAGIPMPDFSAALPESPAATPALREIMTRPYYAIFLSASENVRGSGNRISGLPPLAKGRIGIGAWTRNINLK